MKINKKIILKNTSKLLVLTTISTTGMFPTSFTPRFYSSTAQAKWFAGPYDELVKDNNIKTFSAILKEVGKIKTVSSRIYNTADEWIRTSQEAIDNFDDVQKAFANAFDARLGDQPLSDANIYGVVRAYLSYILSFRGHTLDTADGDDLLFLISEKFTKENNDILSLPVHADSNHTIGYAMQFIIAGFSTKRLLVSAVGNLQNLLPYAVPASALVALSLGSGLIGKAYNGTKVVLGGAKDATKEFLRRNIYNRFALDSDPLVLRKKMEDYLYSIVLCQDKALSKLINIMSGMAEMWRISDKTGEPCKTASTMVFIGDSGIGKTLTARALSELFFKRDMQPWQFITSASIAPTAVSSTDNSKDSKNKNNKNKPQDSGVMTPADRLFSADSELIRQLKLNNKVIIVLDEIDKMHALDPNDTILEKLRNARDTGTIRIKNGVDEETVDVSRTVFICISNEKRECWGLEPVKLTDVQAAARTEIKRDKSLVNRFDVIEFDYFTKEAYTVILKPLLESLQQSYKKLYNINIAIDEDLVCSIAEAAEELNKGARGVNDYMAALYGALVGYRAELLQSGLENSKENLYISAKYNRDSKSFDITQNDPDALIQNYYDSSLAC